MDLLASGLEKLGIGKGKHSKTSSQPQGAFVGGFMPADPSNGYGTQLPPPVPPKKPQMAMPEPTHFDAPGPSLTSQIAMNMYNDQSLPNLPRPPALLRPPQDVPHRPHSDSDLPRPHASPPKTRPTASGPATPPKSSDKLGVPGSPTNDRGRRKSSPGSMGGAMTCSGTTKNGDPCKNTVKRPTALGHVDSDADLDIERYCHVHMKEVLKPSGFHSPRANEWVSYDGASPAL